MIAVKTKTVSKMRKDRWALFGSGLAVVTLLIWFLSMLPSIIGLVMVALMGCGLGMAAEAIYPSPYEHGRWSSTAMGLSGAFIGSLFLGHWGPSIAGVHLIPALCGTIAICGALRGKVWYDRVKTLENYQATAGSDPLVMSVLAEYRVIKLLGSGGFAKVYQSLPDRTLRESESVAIKIFGESAQQIPNFKERTEREVSLCQKLNHPNIMRIHRSGEFNSIHYIVMELVSGESLRTKMDKGPMAIDEALGLLIKLAEGLAHAHSAGVIHRDIKPDNIMLTSNGPKIMDFGLARLEGLSDLTQTGSAMGTPHYMSPEQIQGNKTLDGRCDQYSLGAVGFEMLTGQKVFDGDQVIAVMNKQLTAKPPNPSELRPEIPASLSSILLKTLLKAPDSRYASMDELATALKAEIPKLTAASN